jgi:hypothetical protein
MNETLRDVDRGLRYRIRPYTWLSNSSRNSTFRSLVLAGTRGSVSIPFDASTSQATAFSSAIWSLRSQSIRRGVDIPCTVKIGSANHLHANLPTFLHTNFWTYSEVMLGVPALLRSQEDYFFFS